MAFAAFSVGSEASLSGPGPGLASPASAPPLPLERDTQRSKSSFLDQVKPPSPEKKSGLAPLELDEDRPAGRPRLDESYAYQAGILAGMMALQQPNSGSADQVQQFGPTIVAAEGRQGGLLASMPLNSQQDKAGALLQTNASVDKLGQQLKMLIAGDKPLDVGLPLLNLLDGHLERLAPAQLPQIIFQNSFISDALGQADIAGALQDLAPIGEILSKLGVSQDRLDEALNLGIDLKKNTTPENLLHALGLDTEKIIGRLEELRRDLLDGGSAAYMQKAAVLRAQKAGANRQFRGAKIAGSELAAPTARKTPEDTLLDPRQNLAPTINQDALLTRQGPELSQRPELAKSPGAVGAALGRGLEQSLDRLGQQQPNLNLGVDAGTTRRFDFSQQSTQDMGDLISSRDMTQPSSAFTLNSAAMSRQFATAPSLSDLANPVLNNGLRESVSAVTPVYGAPLSEGMMMVAATRQNERGFDQNSADSNRDLSKDEDKTSIPELQDGVPLTGFVLPQAKELAVNSDKTLMANTGSLSHKIFEKASLLVKEGGGSIQIEVGTEKMGSVNLALHLNNDRLELQIITGSKEARDTLSRDLPQLREALLGQNFDLKSVEIAVRGSSTWTQSNPFGSGQGQGNFSRGQSSAESDDILPRIKSSSRRPVSLPNYRQAMMQQAGRIQVLI